MSMTMPRALEYMIKQENKNGNENLLGCTLDSQDLHQVVVRPLSPAVVASKHADLMANTDLITRAAARSAGRAGILPAGVGGVRGGLPAAEAEVGAKRRLNDDETALDARERWGVAGDGAPGSGRRWSGSGIRRSQIGRAHV